MPQHPTPTRPITQADIDEAAAAMVPLFEAFADKGAQLPPEPPPTCVLHKNTRAPWLGRALYFANDGDTVPKETKVDLCSKCADRWYQLSRLRRLTLFGRPVFKFVLQQRP